MRSSNRVIVTYTGGNRHGREPPVLLLGVMRPRSSIVAFIRLCAASGLGVYLGASIGGIVALVTGEAFDTGSRWLANLAGFAVIGAGVGAIVAWLGRRWLIPRVSRRLLVFTVAGIVTLPLFAAVDEPRIVETVGTPLALVGGVVMVIIYWRASRSSSQRATGSYSRVGSR